MLIGHLRWLPRAGRSCGGVKDDPGVTVQDLPGLSLSACLAVLDCEGDIVAAREAMASALLRFPVMLEPLLEKCAKHTNIQTRERARRPHSAARNTSCLSYGFPRGRGGCLFVLGEGRSF